MFYRAQVETVRATTQMSSQVQMPCLLCRTLVVGQEVLMHLFLGQVRCVTCSATLTTCREFRTLAPFQTYCVKEVEGRGRAGGRSRGRGRSEERGRCKGRSRSRGRGASRGRGRGSRGRRGGRRVNEEISRQPAGPGVDFNEEHGRLGWTMDPVDVLAYYTRRWLLLRGEQPSSPGLLHEMAKFLQIYSPLESLSPWRPAIDRCWQYVTKMSRFHLTRSLRAPLVANEGKQCDKTYSKFIRMSAKEASVGRSGSKMQAKEKDSIQKFSNEKKIIKSSNRSDVLSINYVSSEGEGKIKYSNNKKTTKSKAAIKEDFFSREKSSSPECCYVGKEHKTTRKRKNENHEKIQMRKKQRQNKVDLNVVVEKVNVCSNEIMGKGKRGKASARHVVDIIEVDMDEKDESYGNRNSIATGNINHCESEDQPLLTNSEGLRLSLSNTSFTLYNSQTTGTTSNLRKGEEPEEIQNSEVYVIPPKPLGVPESPVITSDDLTEQALVVPVNSISECEPLKSEVFESSLEKDIESKENIILEDTEMVPSEGVTDSEFGDLLLPRVFSESKLDEAVEVVSLVGCDASWEVEASFTATKLLHVCWEGLDHHSSSREIGSVRS